MQLKRFRLSAGETVNMSGLRLFDSFDRVSDAREAADQLARDARYDGHPLKLILVADGWSGSIEYRTHA